MAISNKKKKPYDSKLSPVEFITMLSRGDRPSLEHEYFIVYPNIATLIAICWSGNKQDRPNFKYISMYVEKIIVDLE